MAHSHSEEGAAERLSMIRETALQFAEREIRPLAAELDESERFPAELYEKMAALGMFGVTIPESQGGVGADTQAYAHIMEALAKGYAAIADHYGLVELVATLLARHGMQEQQARYLRPLLAAKLKCAYAITEPEGGSDVAAIKTAAVETREGWRLSGSKMWIHNGPIADFAVVLARSDPDLGKRGMSIFLVDRDLPGFKNGRKEKKMGQRGSALGALYFDEVPLPRSALLGPKNRGFPMMMSVLDKGRVGIAALAVGILDAALEAAVAYAKSRRQFGRPIADFQAVQWMLADMAKDTHAARLMTLHAAALLDRGERASSEAAMAKCFASDAAVEHTANAVQIHGGLGYIRGIEVERLYRDAKITQIYEGTNQIQRLIIARRLLA